jgi:hypothetical protein
MLLEGKLYQPNQGDIGGSRCSAAPRAGAAHSDTALFQPPPPPRPQAAFSHATATLTVTAALLKTYKPKLVSIFQLLPSDC